MGIRWFLPSVTAMLAMVFVVAPPVGSGAIFCGMGARRCRRAALGAVALVVFAGVAGFACSGPLESLRMCLAAPYGNPPPGLGESELVGTWEARYGRSVDRLVLKTDGTFKQAYASGYVEGYIYETAWNSWGVQRLRDGRVRVLLQGARFYPDGIAVAEEGGWGHGAESFCDPMSVHPVDMDGKLVLNVRVDPDGLLILYHMWSTGDQGFALIGCERGIFRRVQSP